MGHGRSKESHDPVAHHLVHRALVAVNGFHHPLEDGVEDFARLLGIPIGEQAHRAFEVGEEHGDLFALSSSAALDVRIFSARCLAYRTRAM